MTELKHPYLCVCVVGLCMATIAGVVMSSPADNSTELRFGNASMQCVCQRYKFSFFRLAAMLLAFHFFSSSCCLDAVESDHGQQQ